jgi:hypothetical protein
MPQLSSGNQSERVFVRGKCSKTRIDIVWVCAFRSDTGQWVCEEIRKLASLSLAGGSGNSKGAPSFSASDQIPAFVVPDALFCPGCGIRKARWRYYQCGTCRGLNCLGSAARGDGEILITCGHCLITKPVGTEKITHVDGSRQAGADKAKSAIAGITRLLK